MKKRLFVSVLGLCEKRLFDTIIYMKSNYAAILADVTIAAVVVGTVVLFFFLFNSLSKNNLTQSEEINLETQSVFPITHRLETETYRIEVIGCEEGVVVCDDVTYYGTHKETQESIIIENGKTLSTMCADGVTPCRFIGYEFIKDGYTYTIYDEGRFVIKDPTGEVILEEIEVAPDY